MFFEGLHRAMTVEEKPAICPPDVNDAPCDEVDTFDTVEAVRFAHQVSSLPGSNILSRATGSTEQITADLFAHGKSSEEQLGGSGDTASDGMLLDGIKPDPDIAVLIIIRH